MPVSALDRKRVETAKQAFTTRRVPIERMATLVQGDVRPVTGDLVLARVREIGKHSKLERPDGRRSRMVPGNELIVCYGNRYAPDQFEAVVSEDLGICDLVAAGGIAAREVCRHERMPFPTQIEPIGLIGDKDGKRLNLSNFALKPVSPAKHATVIVVAGTAMNSGKTWSAASAICGFARQGMKVAGIKATGTGAGGDIWLMKDLGADVTLDFTDAGYSSTYKIPDADIAKAFEILVNHAAGEGCEIIVAEIADGLHHLETLALLKSHQVLNRSLGVIFAAHESVGARGGYEILKSIGHNVICISGKVTMSPLATREVMNGVDCPIFSPTELQYGSVAELIGRGKTVTGDGVNEQMQRRNPGLVADWNRDDEDEDEAIAGM